MYDHAVHAIGGSGDLEIAEAEPCKARPQHALVSVKYKALALSMNVVFVKCAVFHFLGHAHSYYIAAFAVRD